jgi:hypothetical protein
MLLSQNVSFDNLHLNNMLQFGVQDGCTWLDESHQGEVKLSVLIRYNNAHAVELRFAVLRQLQLLCTIT